MMSQAPTPLETEHGYAPPSARQFSVFLDNRVGKLYELLEVFEEHPQVQVCALSVLDASDHAVIRIIPNNSRLARGLLRERGLAFAEMDLLLVEVASAHSLTRMCLYLLGAELSIHFAYPLMLTSGGCPVIALAVDDQVLAGQILRAKNFKMLGEADLPGPCKGP
ncbi:MAG: hypothetical protein IT430_06060 [Phycisphaerales bacterium]|nr:hypothetical protein [Phycisphaerales bacterium]